MPRVGIGLAGPFAGTQAPTRAPQIPMRARPSLPYERVGPAGLGQARRPAQPAGGAGLCPHSAGGRRSPA